MMNKQWIWLGWLAFFLCAGIFGGKVFWSSRSEFSQGEAAFSRGEFEEALRHYERAIHWYIPGSSSVEKSIIRVWEIGQTMEKNGDTKMALEAYWSLRSSLYGARSFYTPYPEWIEKANERIAGIWVKGEPYGQDEKKMTSPERKEHYLKLIRKDRAPRVGWAAVTEIGFFGWVISALIFIFSFRRPEGGLAKEKALICGGSTIFFYLLWIVGMVRT